MILGQNAASAFFFWRTKRRWKPVLVHLDSSVSIYSKRSSSNEYFLSPLYPWNLRDVAVRSIFSALMSMRGTSKKTRSFRWAHLIKG